MNVRSTGLVVTAAVLVAGCTPPDAGRPDLEAQAYLRVVAAEDMRPAGGPELGVLIDAARHGTPFVRAAGVRALGRLEDAELVPVIAEHLRDVNPTVRATAADALAQAVHRDVGDAALAPLLRRSANEDDSSVRAALARSLGRLSLEGERRWEVGRALLALSRGPGGAWPSTTQTLGAALGMDAFVRLHRGPPPDAMVARLETMVTFPSDDSDAARVREVAATALASHGLLGVELAARALDDLDARVRRAAAASLARMDPDAAANLADRVLRDAAPRVRLEGVRALGAWPRTPSRCRRLLAVAGTDSVVAVRLAALDALARPCPDATAQVQALTATAGSLSRAASHAWHPAVHALASLAALRPAAARPLLAAFAAHADPFVRTWAARVAASVGDGTVLRSLAADPDANTRAAALEGLAEVDGPGAVPLLASVLGEDDAPQVVLAVAPRLGSVTEPSRRREILDAALATLRRLTDTRAETTRDPRLALLDLIGALGDTATVPELEPYLRDFDPAVARRAAETLEAWTGKRYLAAPRSARRLPLPSVADLEAMERTVIVLHMLRGGDVEIRLWPGVAPTNAYRLYTMVQHHALDGLTFHRVVPNFVIQGGSPGANEYAGHGAFTRDEVGLPVQWRGTVGVSTRGRDTGDGQIYVNLVDNVRLDHDYTILGTVTAGMEVVDRVLEGDVIRSAEVRAGH